MEIEREPSPRSYDSKLKGEREKESRENIYANVLVVDQVLVSVADSLRLES